MAGLNTVAVLIPKVALTLFDDSRLDGAGDVVTYYTRTWLMILHGTPIEDWARNNCCTVHMIFCVRSSGTQQTVAQISNRALSHVAPKFSSSVRPCM